MQRLLEGGAPLPGSAWERFFLREDNLSLTELGMTLENDNIPSLTSYRHLVGVCS
jgi:hypothetical protein